MSTIIQEFIAKFYQAVIIVLTAFLLVLLIGFGVQTWRVSHWKTQSENADAKCTAKVNKAKDELKQYKADQKEAIETATDKANEVSADYEQLKATQQVKIQTVRDTVQKIVERPVYRDRNCFDNDGLQQLGKAINLGKTDDTSEPESPMSEPNNSE